MKWTVSTARTLNWRRSYRPYTNRHQPAPQGFQTRPKGTQQPTKKSGVSPPTRYTASCLQILLDMSTLTNMNQRLSSGSANHSVEKT
jgi:hypothetical protein